MIRALSRLVGGTAAFCVLAVLTRFISLPFVWMAWLAVAPGPVEAGQSLPAAVAAQAIANAATVYHKTPIFRFLFNGALVTLSIAGLQILIGAPLAYAVHFHRNRHSWLIELALMIGIVVPHQAALVPLFIAFARLGLLDSYTALILPFLLSPFTTFMLARQFRSVPTDLISAARLDGLSESAILWRVVLPYARPTVAALSILSIVGHWNDLFWPLVAVRDVHLLPPPMGILSFRDQEQGDSLGPMMMAALIVVLPLLLAYLSAQQVFVRGLTSGAVK